MAKTPSKPVGVVKKLHERVNPSGKRDAPDMTYGGKPLKQA